MGVISKPTNFVDGTVPTAAQFNNDLDTIYNEFNGSITNANISATAAIAASKISDTAVTLTAAQTVTGKTLGANLSRTQTYTPAAAGTATLDLSAYTRHSITMPAGNITIALTGASVSQPFIVEITQDSGGSRTVTWFSTIKWAGGSAPTLTTTANKRDTFMFIVTSAGNYDGFVVGQNI